MFDVFPVLHFGLFLVVFCINLRSEHELRSLGFPVM